MATATPTSFYATGRRKQSIARVWLFAGQKGFTVNGFLPEQYLRRASLQMAVAEPLLVTQLTDQFRVRARVTGGGLAGQAGALKLGIARAIVSFDEKMRGKLRQAGLLTRDPREKERKKFGRKGARRSFQYTKR